MDGKASNFKRIIDDANETELRCVLLALEGKRVTQGKRCAGVVRPGIEHDNLTMLFLR